MEEFLNIAENVPPEEVLIKITTITKTLLADFDSDTRERFLINLIGQSEGDKVAGMVHL